MKKIFQNRDFLIILCFSILISLFILCNEFIFNINKYIVLVFICASFLLVKEETSLVVMFSFILPLYNGLPNNLITFCFLIIFLIKYRLKRFSVKYVFIILTVLIYELLHFVFDNFSIYRFLIDSSYILSLFVLITCNKYNSNIYRRVSTFFGLGIIVSCSIILMKMLGSFSIEEILSKGLRLGLISGPENVTLSLNINPNMIAVFCVVSIGLILIRNKIDLLSIGLIILLVIFGSLTVSRNFLFSIIILFLLTIFIGKFKIKFRLIGLIAVLVLLICIFIPEVIYNFVDRMMVDDITNDRMIINGAYFNEWSMSFFIILFGRGLQNYQMKYGIADSVHNATLELFVCWGVVGTILFIYSIIFFIYYNKKEKFNIYDLIVLLTFIISIQSVRLLSAPELLLVLGMILMFRNYNEEECKNIKNLYKNVKI